MPDQTVTVKAYHPYPAFYWEYKLAGGQAAAITGYDAYNNADNSAPDKGHDQKTVAINATVADVGQIRCTIGPASAGTPTPGAEGTTTTDWISVSVGALEWEVNPDPVIKTIQAIPAFTYTDLQAATASASPFTVTDPPHTAGVFNHHTDTAGVISGVVGGRDITAVQDNGTVFTASDGGWWVRDFTYDGATGANAADLDWYQVVEGADIKPAIDAIAAVYTAGNGPVDMFLKASARVNTTCSQITWPNAPIAPQQPLERFKLFSGGASKEIATVTNDGLQAQMFTIQSESITNIFIEPGVILRGYLAPYATWNANNIDGTSLVELSVTSSSLNNNNLQVDIQCDTINAPAYAVSLNSISRSTIVLGGTHISSGVRVYGSSNVQQSCHFNDLVVTDPDGRGALQSDGSHEGGDGWEKHHRVQMQRCDDITGKITTRYGYPRWFMADITNIGVSAQEPFEICYDSHGYDDGDPPGKITAHTGIQYQGGKCDNLYAGTDRYLKVWDINDAIAPVSDNKTAGASVQLEATGDSGAPFHTDDVTMEVNVSSTGSLKIGEMNGMIGQSCSRAKVTGTVSGLSAWGDWGEYNTVVCGQVSFSVHSTRGIANNSELPDHNTLDGNTHTNITAYYGQYNRVNNTTLNSDAAMIQLGVSTTIGAGPSYSDDELAAMRRVDLELNNCTVTNTAQAYVQNLSPVYYRELFVNGATNIIAPGATVTWADLDKVAPTPAFAVTQSPDGKSHFDNPTGT